MSIPGVGVQTSAAFVAVVDTTGRFRQSHTAGAYFGLVPKRHQSGETDWTGRITKQGDSMVRKLLYEAAKSILTRSRGSFALKGVTTRRWRICPTFKNVSGTQVGLTVDVVAFSALRAS